MKYVLRMFGEHIIASLAVLFLMTPLVLIFQDNSTYQTFVSVVLAFCYWTIAGRYFAKEGKKHKKDGTNGIKTVLLSSLVFILPDILLVVGKAVSDNDLFLLLFRYWNIGYMNIEVILNDPMWLRIVITLSYLPGFLLSYLVGVWKQNRNLSVINTEENRKETDNE